MASSMSRRSIALVDSASSTIPRLIEHVVGDLLELMVYSIEGLRDRFAASLRRPTP
jgi:hypothetical protein